MKVYGKKRGVVLLHDAKNGFYESSDQLHEEQSVKACLTVPIQKDKAQADDGH
jgi:hypothetical protein